MLTTATCVPARNASRSLRLMLSDGMTLPSRESAYCRRLPAATQAARVDAARTCLLGAAADGVAGDPTADVPRRGRHARRPPCRHPVRHGGDRAHARLGARVAVRSRREHPRRARPDRGGGGGGPARARARATLAARVVAG